MTEIGIVTTAVNIDLPIIHRWKDTLRESTTTAYQSLIMNDDKYLENGLLNKSRALNDGIKKLLDQCKIVVCTDIDMLIPPGLVNYTVYVVKPMNCLWGVSRNINPDKITPRRWRDWLQLPLRNSGYGSWNAMLKEDWLLSGGWDERLTGWGGEDDLFKKRRTQRGIHTMICDTFPLMHINHPSRQDKEVVQEDSQHNMILEMPREDRNWLI